MRIRQGSLVAAMCLTLASVDARAGAHNYCTSGSCVNNTPVFVNVYWDSSAAQWDKDAAAAGVPDATVGRIDGLTNALVHSQYFSGLLQYGVGNVSAAPSVVASNCGPPPPTIEAAFSAMPGLVPCVVASHPALNNASTVLNVLLPPQVTSSSSAWCDPSNPKSTSARHDLYVNPGVSATFTPTNPACNNGVSNVFAVMTHEMVEAATDPNVNSGYGWRMDDDVTEIADVCKSSEPFLYGSVDEYFANNINACTSGFSLTPPSSNGSVCGSGGRMRITLNGAMGGVPFDVVNGSSRSLYVHAVVSGSHNWAAGHSQFFPPDDVGFGAIRWSTPSSVVLDGFDAAYNTFSSLHISPGDRIDLTIWSPSTGQFQTTHVTAPNPTDVKDLHVKPIPHPSLPPWILFGDTVSVLGTLVDVGGCGVEGVPVVVTSNDPSATTSNTRSSSDGIFTTPYQPKDAAGHHTVKVTAPVMTSTTIDVHPVATTLSSVIGDVMGGQLITLLGAGYVAGRTQVQFRPTIPSKKQGGPMPADAVIVSVPDSTRLTLRTPASPLRPPGIVGASRPQAGVVDVVALVDGVASIALSYRYIVPYQPVFTYYPKACGMPQLTVDAYQPDGTEASEQVTLTAGYAALQPPTGGALVSTLTVAAGATVGLSGSGPVTATPSLNSASAISESFTPGTPPHDCMPLYTVVERELPQSGPIDGRPIVPTPARQGDAVVWQNGVGDRVVIVDRAAAAISRAVVVREVALGELRDAIRHRPYAFAHESRGLAHVRFVGDALAIESHAKPGATKAPQVSFVLPGPNTDSRYVVLRRATDVDSWTEEPSSPAEVDGRIWLRAGVTGDGLFALAQLEK
jgi:hypothetical protein